MSRALVPALLAMSGPLAAQHPTNWNPEIIERPRVRSALRLLERGFEAQIAEWIRITEIPAPSEMEARRGAYVAAALRRAGLKVEQDSIGNVFARRKGRGGAPAIVLAAHLDVAQPTGVDVRVRRHGDTLRAPGVFDNSASLANMLAVARVIQRERIQTDSDIVFLATVQEEIGVRGMDFWLRSRSDEPMMVIAMDGGIGPIAYGALGIYWSRFVFSADGAHTFFSAGRPHPARALAAAIRAIYEIRIPGDPPQAIVNVGMLHGGSVVNAIPQEVSFTVDLRSPDPALIDSLDREIAARAERAAGAERVGYRREVIQQMPAAGTAEMLRSRRVHPLVQTAVDIHRYLGLNVGNGDGTEEWGSTDANAAVVRAIPAISVGRSYGAGQHTLDEWSDIPSALPATKMVLLLTLTMVGVLP